ncbi:MAG: alkaline phosphatase [Burkholderiaceae bacterium]
MIAIRALCLIGSAALTLTATSAGAQATTAAQNVIVLIGNGLGPTATTAARVMRYKEDGTLAMDLMPNVARVRTWSLDAQTSDSTAAVSALLTGVKVRNDVVAMDGTTRALEFAPGKDPVRGVANAENHCPATGNGVASRTLLELAVTKNRATGIVTTGRLTAGAAAAAYAHICHRNAEFEVARQAVPGGAGFNASLGRGIDVMMGGISSPWRPFDAARRPRGRPDARELVGELQTLGYTVVSDLTAMNAAPITAGSRVIGLYDFAEDQGAMSYELDRDPKREPSLAQMTSKAIDVLSTNRNGYVLVVEGGRIGQAQRASSARRALFDTTAFDDAVKVALDKVDLTKTLVVVTGDHDTTMAYIGGGRRGSDVLGLHLNPVTGKPDVDANGAPYTSLVYGTGSNRPDRRAPLDSPTVLQKDYQQEAAIKLGAGTNGGGDVILRASGAGASTFRGTIDNTRVFALIRRAADL